MYLIRTDEPIEYAQGASRIAYIGRSEVGILRCMTSLGERVERLVERHQPRKTWAAISPELLHATHGGVRPSTCVDPPSRTADRKSADGACNRTIGPSAKKIDAMMAEAHSTIVEIGR